MQRHLSSDCDFKVELFLSFAQLSNSMFVLFKRGGQASRPFACKWIHTTKSNLETKKPGSRARVYRKRLTEIKLLNSLLKTNYFQHTKLSPSDPNYDALLDPCTWKRLEYSIKSSLQPKRSMAALNHTDHLEIIIPVHGSYYFQNYLVRQLAIKAKADLFFLDFFDLAKLEQQFLQNSRTLNFIENPDSVQKLIDEKQEKPDQFKQSTKQDVTKVYRKEEDMSEEEEESEDEIEKNEDESNHSSDDDYIDAIENGKITIRFKEKDHDIDPDSLGKDESEAANVLLDSMSSQYKALFKNLLSSNETKKVIHLRDCNMMRGVFTLTVLESLVDITEELRQEGYGIMLLATHSSSTSIKHQFSPILNNASSTILTPFGGDWNGVMSKDETRRIVEINAKNWLAVSKRKSVYKIKVPPYQGTCINSVKELPGISESVWSLEELERRSAMVIGRAIENHRNTLDFDDFKTVNDIFLDSLKKALLGTEKSFYKHDAIDLQVLRESCNAYERKLVGKIVEPNKLQDSFMDICTKPSTIETLHSLISLPLTHHEFFNRGILKKNFIPGILLFGPSGTGKTMLAKAVAKESGSKMLDIQASDVYNMYVGQGEKNVRAVFSLARKISPCVIFIDEVDSLMAKRGSDNSSKSHREIINQFMVEWDGLSSQNQGIVVIAATNRPFDLDDAVLRRMPRRILVDLPNEQDRLEILKILLKEQEHQANLVELSKHTKNYTGSDLKNMCVTAALKAAHEHVKLGNNGVVTLTKDHFNEALKVVLPSLSEEMETLSEIRKWYNQFGDGEKKKKTSLGFF